MLAAVVGIYAAVVVTAAALVPDHHAWWPSALAAALAALALIPLRERLQRGVTRLVYGRWHEPYEVLAGLGQDLEAAADIGRLLEAAVAELTTGLNLREVSVRDLGGTVVTGPEGPAGSGSHAGAAAAPGMASIPLLAYGTRVGSLTYRVPGRPPSAAEERLLDDLAAAARRLLLHARALRRTCSGRSERLVLGTRGGTAPAAPGPARRARAGARRADAQGGHGAGAGPGRPGSDRAPHVAGDLSDDIRAPWSTSGGWSRGCWPPASTSWASGRGVRAGGRPADLRAGPAVRCRSPSDAAGGAGSSRGGRLPHRVRGGHQHGPGPRGGDLPGTVSLHPAGSSLTVTDDGIGLGRGRPARRQRVGHDAGAGRGAGRHPGGRDG